MENLIDLIENTIDIPYIEENDTVQDGCFAVTPYLTQYLRGDGVPIASHTRVEVTVFYNSKLELMATCQDIVVLLSENKYVCSDPSYVYDSNGELYKASINVDYNETL